MVPDKQKLRKFITTKPALQEMLKGVFEAEVKERMLFCKMQTDNMKCTDKGKHIVKFRIFQYCNMLLYESLILL